MKTTVVHHSADYDGIFCREIARKFLPDAELIGWNFGDNPINPETIGETLYVLDLPLDQPFGFKVAELKDDPAAKGTRIGKAANVVWIDHHASSIASHPTGIPGYRIDGVAACRLAWQLFSDLHDVGMTNEKLLPTKQMFIDRKVLEPLAVRLAGEYDIWDKRDPNAELFQHGLRSQELDVDDWNRLLDFNGGPFVERLLRQGQAIQYFQTAQNASVIKELGFTVQFGGLTFLACNAARYNSLLFTAGLKPEHDACLGFKWTGTKWSVSLYHAPGKEHHDLSLIAVEQGKRIDPSTGKPFGGGGHKGACGWVTDKLPFL